MICIECTPPGKRGGGWKTNIALGARFQKMRRAEFSEGHGGAKFSEGAGF